MSEMAPREKRMDALLTGMGELFHEKADIDEMMDVVAVYIASQWYQVGVTDADVPEFLNALAFAIIKALDKFERALTPTGMVN